jgi:hypothetical protein
LAEGSQKTGLIVSGAVHAALLAVLVFGFARAPRFDDAAESIPVETISAAQLNDIMEGVKTAKPAPPKPAPQPPAPQPPTSAQARPAAARAAAARPAAAHAARAARPAAASAAAAP